MKIAAVTMAYNEPNFVPIWVRHYAAQVGAEHCYIVDHGSDDGSTEGLGAVNRVRIPRSPKDNPRRAELMSDFCAALLHSYHWVIQTDIDELLVADPSIHASLHDLCAASPDPVITAVGLNVVHMLFEEPAIDPAIPVSHQRRWTMMITAMCKPLLISHPVHWTPGFHTSDAPVAFGPVFLFHLRLYDLQQGLKRLATTRSMPWADAEQGRHQRVSDDEHRDLAIWAASRPRNASVSLELSQPPLKLLLGQLLAQPRQRAGELYKINIMQRVEELWRIPDRFVGTF